MGTQVTPFPSPVTYPTAVVGGKQYQFRYTKSTQFMLEMWGFDLTPGKTVPALAWAAAMAGFGDPIGNWKSAGFKTPVEFTDAIGLEDDLNPLYEAVTVALKKVAPQAQVTLTESAGSNKPPIAN